MDERGAPVAQARVQTADSSAITDRDDGFAITAIPEGVDDPPPVTLVLRGVGSITGVVTMADRPQEGCDDPGHRDCNGSAVIHLL